MRSRSRTWTSDRKRGQPWSIARGAREPRADQQATDDGARGVTMHRNVAAVSIPDAPVTSSIVAPVLTAVPTVALVSAVSTRVPAPVSAPVSAVMSTVPVVPESPVPVVHAPGRGKSDQGKGACPGQSAPTRDARHGQSSRVAEVSPPPRPELEKTDRGPH